MMYQDQYEKNPLFQAIKNNKLSLVNQILTSQPPPDKNDFDDIFQHQLSHCNKFGIKIDPDILTMLSERGYFSVGAKALYFAKNNEFTALQDLLKNAALNTVYNRFFILYNTLMLAVKNGSSEMVEMISGQSDTLTFYRADALRHLANRDTTEMLENQEQPKIANILLPNSLYKAENQPLQWDVRHVTAFEKALEKEKLWLIEMFMIFPVFGFLAEFKKYNSKTPLSYALSKTKKDESILLFLIKHALDTGRFGIHFENVFFEKTDDGNSEYIWNKHELTVLFKVVLQFPTQADALLTRFPTIFRPIAEITLSGKEDIPPLSGTHPNHSTLIGQVLEAHGLLPTTLPPNQYQSNTVLQNQTSNRKHKRDEATYEKETKRTKKMSSK